MIADLHLINHFTKANFTLLCNEEFALLFKILIKLCYMYLIS